LEEGVPERVAPLVFGITQKREFPGELTVRFLVRRNSKYAEHLRKPVFFFWRYSIHAEHYVGVDQLLFRYVWRIFLSVMLDRRLCTAKLLNSLSINPPKLSVFYFPQSKIKYPRSKNCSAGNPPPIVNPGLKRTGQTPFRKNSIEK
jgi:hypothetical protein